MPRIRGATVAEHRALVWEDLLLAFEALVNERGYDRVTLPDVATRAGIARNTIYGYVDDKSGLLEEAARRSAAALNAAVLSVVREHETASRRLEAVVGVLVDAFARDARMVLMLRAHAATVGPGSPPTALAPFASLVGGITQVVAEGIRSKEFAAVDDLDATVELMAGVMAASVDRVLGGHEDGDVAARRAWSFMLGGLLGHSPTAELDHAGSERRDV